MRITTAAACTGALLVCLNAALPAYADELGFTIPTVGLTDRAAGNPAVNLGMIFTPSVNLTVYALGFYEFTGVVAETVGIFNSSGTLLASTSVPLTATLDGGFLMSSITPLALTAGQEYTVVDYASNGAFAYDYNAPIANSNITFDGSTYLYTSNFGFPSTHDVNEGYYGGDMDFQPLNSAPEPGSLALLGTALAGWICLRRRRTARQ